MTGYPIASIIERGIDLYNFDFDTWEYDPVFDIVLVKEGSKIFTYLALALT